VASLLNLEQDEKKKKKKKKKKNRTGEGLRGPNHR
jgi:hypothetical protein